MATENKRFTKFSDKTPLSLNLSGNILGVERDLTFKEKSMDFVPGDKVFLFTDGLIECTNEKKEAWGRKVMIEHILTHIEHPAEKLKQNVVDDAYKFFDGFEIKNQKYVSRVN